MREVIGCKSYSGIILSLICLVAVFLNGCGSEKQDNRDSKEAGNYQLTITKEGRGDFEPATGGKYASGTVVPLSATPENGWYFYRWEGTDRSLVVDSKVVMTKDISLKAAFFKYGFSGTLCESGIPVKKKFHFYLNNYQQHIYPDYPGDNWWECGTYRTAQLESDSDGRFFAWFEDDLDLTQHFTFVIKEDDFADPLFESKEIRVTEGMNELGRIDLKPTGSKANKTTSPR